jgi:predicted nucleic-acid-binding protein
MRAVDTNLIVRLFVRDDESQAERVDDFIESGAWVSHLVLTEAVWVFKSVYGAPRAQLRDAVETLLTHDRLSLEDSDVVRRALAHFSSNTKISFSDCMIFEIARKAGHSPLGTFDKALAKLEGTKVI